MPDLHEAHFLAMSASTEWLVRDDAEPGGAGAGGTGSKPQARRRDAVFRSPGCAMQQAAPMQELSQVDLVFCIDLTNSMSPFLMRAKQHLVRSSVRWGPSDARDRLTSSTPSLVSPRPTLRSPLSATQITLGRPHTIPSSCTTSATRCRW